MEKINNFLIGGGGLTTSILMADVDINAVVNLLVQVIIGVATLFGIFKKKKGGKNGSTD